MGHPGSASLLVPPLGHDGGDLGLHPEVHQDPLVLLPLLRTPGLGALSEEPGVLDGTVRVPGPGDDAAGRQLLVPDGVVHQTQRLGAALLPRHHPLLRCLWPGPDTCLRSEEVTVKNILIASQC